MIITEELLQQRYSNMDTEELVELYHTRELTEMASGVMQKIFLERGVTIEERKNIIDRHEKVHRFEREISIAGRPAPLSIRFIAQALDVFIPLFTFAVVAYITNYAGAVMVPGMFSYFGYLLLQDALPNGQSLGKRLMGISVVNKSSGKACGVAQSVIRNGLLYILSFIDLLFLLSRSRQRLGDILANTKVVWIERKPKN